MSLVFKPWSRTVAENISEFEAWDETDEWFVMVSKKRWFVWFWYVAYALKDSDDALFKCEGVEVSRKRAQQKALEVAFREHERRSEEPT